MCVLKVLDGVSDLVDVLGVVAFLVDPLTGVCGGVEYVGVVVIDFCLVGGVDEPVCILLP